MRIPIVAVLIASCGVCAPRATADAQPGDPSIPDKVAGVLREIRAADRGRLAVSEEDGRFLRLLVTSHHVQHALEIGSASGYSAIWLGLGLRATGGKLVTIEYDAQRAREATANVASAGLSDVVQVVSGDGFAVIPKLPGTFDFVFMDVWKRDYKKFFDLVFPRLDRGGLFLAHNVINKRNDMGDFLTEVQTNPRIMTAIVAPSGEGMSISLRLK
jgi:predicted O-methyltransferase YrrM